MSKRLFYTVILILGVALAGCTSSVPPTETPAPTSPPASATLAASPTALPSATATALPSATPTLEPTATPIPQPTATAAPTLTPEPTLPPVPAGMTAERLEPALWVVRVVASDGNIRTEAAANSDILAKLACGSAPVQADTSATGDATGLHWYHLITGGWIREDIIKTYPDATAAEAAAKAAKCTVPTTTGGGSGTDFTPKVAQVWNFTQSQDNMSGTCAGGPILPPYGLVKITPQGNSLLWQSQEGIPYTFARSQPNTYSYSGPAVVGEATVTMVLKFTGTETLTMSRAYVANSEPTCTHTHYYTGAFQWASP
jgi:hypothetical protein